MNHFVKPRPVALITGAFRGIGLACAKRLASAGFNLLLNDRPGEENVEKSGMLADDFAQLGAECLPVLGDISDLSGHLSLLSAALNRWGRIDCLVNNAGVSARQRGDLLDVSPESFDTC